MSESVEHFRIDIPDGALEEPDLRVRDIRGFFRGLR